MSEISKAELKLTVAKLVELSMDSNKEVTVALLRKKGIATIKVDQDGKVTVTGSGKVVSFSGDPALSKLSVKIKRMSVTFSNMDGMRVGYNVSVTGPYGVAASLSGSVDLEELILACSGFLCQSARAMKNRDQQMQKAMGY